MTRPVPYVNPQRHKRSKFAARLWPLPLWLVLLLCCGLPLGWLLLQLVLYPATLAALWPDAWYLRLLGRTLGYNFAAALIAMTLGLPAALVLGRGRGFFAGLLWFLLPASLLLPSIAYTYGWSQFLRLAAEPLGALAAQLPAGSRAWFDDLGLVLQAYRYADGSESPRLVLALAGPADVFRCIWSLGTWLWPLPAGIIGLSLRRLDANLQQQALLDGALWRITARQLAGPVAASLACATILAAQEFAVYEPTGISVVATEVRQVFQTGLVSSADNPITAPMDVGATLVSPSDGAANGMPGTAGPSGGEAGRATQVSPLQPLSTQSTRAAAAIATALPLLAVIFALGFLALWAGGRASAAEEVEEGGWPSVLDAGWRAKLLAGLVVLVAVAVPVGSMVLALRRELDPVRVWRQSGPEVSGSLFLAALAGLAAAAVAFWAAVRRMRFALPLAVVSFLVGGQLLAIALIRLYNRPSLGWVYDAPPIMVMAYLARFSWLALLAAGATYSRPWRALRDLAAVDGAGPVRAAVYVVWPLAWPLLLASAVLVAVLSLTEVPATVLISPLRPEPVVPKLMAWVHILENDPMIEACLLLVSLTLALSALAAGLVWLGLRLARGGVARV